MGIYTDKKTGRFFVQFDYQGQTYKFRLPKGTTQKQADAFETKKKSELFFEAHGVSKRKETLYEEFLVRDYLPFIEANRCADTFEQCVRIMKDSLKFFKGRSIRSLKPADIEKFKVHRMNLPKYNASDEDYTGDRRAASTVAKEISHISKMFNMAIKNDLCDYNPCSRVEMPRYDNVQNDIVDPADEEKFYASFDSAWAAAVTRVILNTGLRQNDILGLTKFSVDWHSEEIVLVQGKVKQPVRIPMNETVKLVVREWWDKHKDSELVFPSPKTGKQGTSIKTALRGAARRAKLSINVGSRVLRRTFGTRLHELGYDDSTVAGLLGHRDLRSVHRYKRGTEIKRTAVRDLETASSQQPQEQNTKAAGKAAS